MRTYSTTILLCAACAAGLPAAQLTSGGPDAHVGVWLPPPDPCVGTQIQIDPAPWPSHDQVVLGAPARFFEAGPGSDPGDPARRHDPSTRPLVLIIDGNGFTLGSYDDLAGYLAVHGFNVVVIDRPRDGGPNPVSQALAAIAAAFETFGLQAGLPVGLVGHSLGGDIAIDAILENRNAREGYDIEALVLLAPKVSHGTAALLGSDDVPALLAVYGSQDNDVGGLGEDLTDAFAAYDRSGTESSTTCHGAWCFYQAQMHRLMVYAHGADHSGLINRVPGFPSAGNPWDPYTSFLATPDQFCIAKAYTLAMLEWTLDANDAWSSMVHGRHVPASIQSMTTQMSDELGNPSGTPLRLGVQVSPRRRSVVENFEDGTWNVFVETPGISRQLASPGAFAGGDLNVRHASSVGVIGWQEHDDWQLLGLTVPAARRNVTGFTHVAVRLGQLAGVSDSAVANPANTFQRLMIGLHDGDSTDWEWSDDHGPILPADRRPNGQHQSVMGTIRIPLSAFHGLDKTSIEGVLLAFPEGTRGTLLIDSLEWFRE